MTKKRTCHLGIMMGSAVMYVQLVQDKLGSTSSQLNNVFGANFLSSSYNCFCYVRANTVFLILNWVNIEGDRDSQDFWGFLAILVQLLTLQTKWTENNGRIQFNIIAHSAVLPYLPPLPLFLEFRGREGWPKLFRGGWKSAFLINFNESFRYKFIRKRFEVD